MFILVDITCSLPVGLAKQMPLNNKRREALLLRQEPYFQYSECFVTSRWQGGKVIRIQTLACATVWSQLVSRVNKTTVESQ